MYENIGHFQKHNNLILNATNYVTVNFVANIQLASGSSPAMSDNLSDLLDLAPVAGGALINLGTPIESNFTAIEAFSRLMKTNYPQRPLVIDMVAFGATKLRNEIGQVLIKNANIIKGNSAEMHYLAYGTFTGKGVDAGDAPTNPQAIVETIAKKHKVIAVMTGPVDWISDGTKTLKIQGGHEYLGNITGTGCALGGLIASFNTSNVNIWNCSDACILMKQAAKLAATKAGGPYTMQDIMLDELYHLTHTPTRFINSKQINVEEN